MRSLVIATLALAAGAAHAQSLELTKPIATVEFSSGSARLAGDAREELSSAVSWLAEHPDRLLVIQGYADRVGAAPQNLELSQDRADAVRDALLALGADPLRIVEVSYGEEEEPGRRVDVRGTLVEFPDIVRGQNPRLSPRTPLPPPRPATPPRRRSGSGGPTS